MRVSRLWLSGRLKDAGEPSADRGETSMDPNEIRELFERCVVLCAAGICERDELHDRHPDAYPYSAVLRKGVGAYGALCALCAE